MAKRNYNMQQEHLVALHAFAVLTVWLAMLERVKLDV